MHSYFIEKDTFVIEFDTIILNGVSHCSPNRTTQVSRKRSIDDAIITTHNIDSLVDPPITEDTREIMRLKKHRLKQEYVTVRGNREMCTEHSVYMEIKLWMAYLYLSQHFDSSMSIYFRFKHSCRKKNHFWAIKYREYSYHLRVLLALNGIVHSKITNAIIIYVWSSLFFGTQNIF